MVKAYYPGGSYVALSVTGTYCGLQCRYCGGRYLRGMIDASSPILFEKLIKNLYAHGVKGFLISGGFNRNGYLMISDEHLNVLKRFTKLVDDVVISAHLGLAPKDLLKRLMDSGVSLLDFEIPPSNRYLREVKGLGCKHSVAAYLNYLDYCMREYGRESIAPHLIACSASAEHGEEISVLEHLSSLKPYLIVILLEINGEDFNERRAEKVLRLSRRLFSEVSLGCMRPSKAKSVEARWISEGLVDRVAVPRRAVARFLGLKVVRACCSLPRRFEALFSLR